MIGADLVHDGQSKEPAGKICPEVAYRVRELGVVVFYVGRRSNVLELTPPIMLSQPRRRRATDSRSGLRGGNIVCPTRGWRATAAGNPIADAASGDHLRAIRQDGEPTCLRSRWWSRQGRQAHPEMRCLMALVSIALVIHGASQVSPLVRFAFSSKR
jgi:hypothetical protein